MKKDRLKAYRDAYAGMLFECAGYAKVIGRNDDADVLFRLSLDFMGWNQTQKGIDKRSKKQYDDNIGTLPTKKEEEKEMKTFDLIDKGKYITVFNAGILEKTFNLSLSKSETIQNVKVIGKSGDMIVLRYVWYPETEHINHTAERFEKWIDENYTRA